MLRIVCLSLGTAAALTAPAKAENVARATAIYAMDADGSDLRKLASIPDYPIINSPEVSPDGRYVAVDGWRNDEDLRDARVLIVDLKNGSVINFGKGAMPSWSSDGQWFAFCKYAPERGVYIRSVDGDEERLIDADGWGIQWSPDGMKAAYTRDGRFVIYDFIADTRRTVSWGTGGRYARIYWNCKWSPDSRRICFKGRRPDGTHEIGIVNVVGADPQLRVVCDGSEFNPDIGWSPDGSRITLPKRSQPGQPGQIFVFNPNRYEAPVPLKGQPTDRANSGMCWTRDGETFIFLSRGPADE